MKQALVIVAALAALLIAATAVFRPGGISPSAQAVEQTPWQVDPLPGGGSRVFGLVLAGSPDTEGSGSASAPAGPPAATLADARRAFGPSVQLGLIGRGSEPGGTLEAYVDGLTAGFVTGKLVLLAQVSPQQARDWRNRATKQEPLQSGALRHTLAEADEAAALQAPVIGASFVPSPRLDAAMVVQRFGPAAQQIQAGGQLHLLYPRQGLVVSLQGDGQAPARAVIQYVAPARFATLSQPLHGPAGPAPARASSP